MRVRRGGTHNVRRVGGRVVDWLKVGCQAEKYGGGGPKTSSVPTEDTLESMGDVGVEMLDGNVASEVTVEGLDGGRT